MIEVYAQKQWHKCGVDFHLIDRHPAGDSIGIGRPVVFNEQPAESPVFSVSPEPAFFLRTGQIQALIDQLWDLGFRPSEGTGSTGSLKQAENHISSLQKIAFALLPK